MTAAKDQPPGLTAWMHRLSPTIGIARFRGLAQTVVQTALTRPVLVRAQRPPPFTLMPRQAKRSLKHGGRRSQQGDIVTIERAEINRLALRGVLDRLRAGSSWPMAAGRCAEEWEKNGVLESIKRFWPVVSRGKPFPEN